MTHSKYRAWSGAIGHMLFDFGIANLSLVGYLFKEWQNMSLMISILPFSKAILPRLFYKRTLI